MTTKIKSNGNKARKEYYSPQCSGVRIDIYGQSVQKRKREKALYHPNRGQTNQAIRVARPSLSSNLSTQTFQCRIYDPFSIQQWKHDH